MDVTVWNRCQRVRSASVMDGVEIENCSYENGQREQYYDAANYPVDHLNAIFVEFPFDFMDEPCKSEPPQQRADNDAQIARRHFERMVRNHECELREKRHEQKDNERIEERYPKCGKPVIKIRTFFSAAHVHVFCGIAPETVHPEEQQDYASRNVQNELRLRIVHEIHHETQSQSCNKCVDNIADRSAYASNKTIPSAFIQRALYAKNTHGAHRC